MTTDFMNVFTKRRAEIMINQNLSFWQWVKFVQKKKFHWNGHRWNECEWKSISFVIEAHFTDGLMVCHHHRTCHELLCGDAAFWWYRTLSVVGISFSLTPSSKFTHSNIYDVYMIQLIKQIPKRTIYNNNTHSFKRSHYW